MEVKVINAVIDNKISFTSKITRGRHRTKEKKINGAFYMLI